MGHHHGLADSRVFQKLGLDFFGLDPESPNFDLQIRSPQTNKRSIEPKTSQVTRAEKTLLIDRF
jgi:hypothetical protein